MLRFFDKIWGWLIGREETNFKIVDTSPKIDINKGHKDTWVMFIPYTSFNIKLYRNRITPRKGNVIMYKMPKEILSPDIIRYKSMFVEYYKNALSILKKRKVKIKNLYIVGMSMGAIPAFMLANNFGCKKLISVAGVCDIVKEMEKSVASKLILKKALENGYTHKLISKELDKISPKNNYKNIRGEIEMYLGKYDYIVPSEESIKLAKRMMAKGRKVKLIIHPNIGHVLTIMLFKIK